MNWALLDKVANEEERRRLSMENEELRVILKQYLNGISVTPDTIEVDNPLVVINCRSGIAIHRPVREGAYKIHINTSNAESFFVRCYGINRGCKCTDERCSKNEKQMTQQKCFLLREHLSEFVGSLI